jgi:hypothetical protein
MTRTVGLEQCHDFTLTPVLVWIGNRTYCAYWMQILSVNYHLHQPLLDSGYQRRTFLFLKLRDLIPRTDYTYRATASCRQS